MLLRSIAVLATWLSMAWRAYLSRWRVTVPASPGAVFGLWFGSFLSGFGLDNDFTTPLGLPTVCFRLIVVAFFAVGFAVIGKRWLGEHFPR